MTAISNPNGNFGRIIVIGVSFLKKVEKIDKCERNYIPPNPLYGSYILLVEILGEKNDKGKETTFFFEALMHIQYFTVHLGKSNSTY